MLFDDDLDRNIVSENPSRDLLAKPASYYRGYYVLVFDAAILRVRKDYHANLCDHQGYLDDRSYDSAHLDDLVRDRKTLQSRMNNTVCDSNELVFHHRVSLRPYLHQIVVLGDSVDSTDETWKVRTLWLLEQLFASKKLSHDQRQWYMARMNVAFLDKPQSMLSRGLSVRDSFDKVIQQWEKEASETVQTDKRLVPRYCSAMFVGDDMKSATKILQGMKDEWKGTLSLLKRVAQKCGLSDDAVRATLSQGDTEYVALRSLIHDTEMTIIETGNTPKAAQTWN
jgi:hypothetical protein